MTPQPRGEAVRSPLERAFETALACGLLPTLAVALGGAAAGVIVWEPFGTAAPPLLAGISFLVLALGGAFGAFVIWLRGNVLLAARTAIPPIDLMRWDAWSWGALVAAPLVFLPALRAGPAAAVVAALLGYCAGKVATLARYDESARDATIAFLCSRVPVALLMIVAPFVLIPGKPDHGEVARRWLAGFARWDGLHYLAIARHGYAGADTAFFPAYPMLMRLTGSLLHSDVAAGILISNVAFFVALVFLRRLIALDGGDSGVAQRTIFYIAIFPTAMFFSVLYAESLFLCLSVLFFYALRTQRLLLAGLIGGLAATTRVEGILLLVPYVVDAFSGRAVTLDMLLRSRPLRRRLVSGGVAIVMGLLLYMLFLAALTGDPLAFESVQSHWSRHLAPPWVSLALQIGRLTSPRPEVVVESGIEFAFAVLAIVLVAFAFRRVTPAQWCYAVVSLLVPLCTASLLSIPRFLVVIFPLFVVLAGWGRSPVANLAIVCLSLPLLGAFALLFAASYWVS